MVRVHSVLTMLLHSYLLYFSASLFKTVLRLCKGQ
nr:MAG TPA_asm: hypothetical protein [Caudoviricetes sp.]